MATEDLIAAPAQDADTFTAVVADCLRMVGVSPRPARATRRG
ncbi:hypothetical protein [Stenotrophomonas sepilia]